MNAQEWRVADTARELFIDALLEVSASAQDFARDGETLRVQVEAAYAEADDASGSAVVDAATALSNAAGRVSAAYEAAAVALDAAGGKVEPFGSPITSADLRRLGLVSHLMGVAWLRSEARAWRDVADAL